MSASIGIGIAADVTVATDPTDPYVQSPAQLARNSAHMTGGSKVTPQELQGLLHGTDAADRDAAWGSLVQSYTNLLLYAVRSVIPEHDAAMDAYAYVLERLREDDYRRLRSYVSDGRSMFGTWLVVVTRRLCVDHHRQRYGRSPRGERDAASAKDQRLARRRLLHLTGSPIEVADLADAGRASAEVQLRTAELYSALDAAVADLAPADRVLLKLRFEDSLSAQEIASALGLPTPFHVYRRLNAVYADLRRRLNARGVVNGAP
jgi:RNA polymerase sigma factor (sigma-70 family)